MEGRDGACPRLPPCGWPWLQTHAPNSHASLHVTDVDLQTGPGADGRSRESNGRLSRLALSRECDLTDYIDVII